MSASASDLERLRKQAGAHGDGLRFRQGDGVTAGAAVDANTLVDTIHTLLPVSLVEPVAHELAWNDAVARRWACDCVEHAMPAAAAVDTDGYVASLEGAIHTAREYLDGEADLGTLDAVFTELFVEEWPTYEGPFFRIVAATRQATARDLGEVSHVGVGIVFAGTWAATAAREARSAVADSDAERRWQTARLLDYLLLGAGDGPVS
jgi:hypothetical protein